jgi:hypothetical protein
MVQGGPMRPGGNERMLTRGDCQCLESQLGQPTSFCLCERLWPRTGLGAPNSVAISRDCHGESIEAAGGELFPIGCCCIEVCGQELQKFLRIVTGKNSIHRHLVGRTDWRYRNQVEIGTHLLEPAHR